MMRQPTDPFHQDETEVRKTRAWWGIAGMILVAAFIGIAYVLSPTVAARTHIWVPQSDPVVWRWIVAAAIFVLLLMVSGIIYSFLIPKRKDMFSEREMKKELKEIRMAEAAKIARQKQVRKQIAQERRKGK